MKLYVLVIVIAASILALINAFFMPWWLSPALVTYSVIGCIALHGAGAGIIYSMRRFIKPTSWYFKVSKRETRFWEFFGVRKFKDLLPDLGGKFVGFEKARLANPKDTEYIKKYIHETCVGEIGHILGGILGFAVLLLLPMHYYWLIIALPCAVVNLFLAILPIITMRYNRYKLLSLLKIVEIQNLREERKKTEEEVSG